MAAEQTRERLLAAAFAEFYRHGFQGGSLSRILTAAGLTKGALFHHFAGKRELGYAVVDEIIGPLLSRRWLAAVEGEADPLTAMETAYRRYVRQDIASGSWLQGCPLNNLAQEMSPLDEGFRTRVDTLYARWRAAYRDALAAGQAAGMVSSAVHPEAAATLLVASQIGIWGTGKFSQNPALMEQAAEAVCQYLHGLRPAGRRETNEGNLALPAL